MYPHTACELQRYVKELTCMKKSEGRYDVLVSMDDCFSVIEVRQDIDFRL